VHPTVFIFGCIACSAIFVFALVYAYKLSPSQSWRAIVRKVTPHAQARITLQEGETLVAVVETKKGTYFFLGTQTRKGSYSE
jgi:hypothetical protein